MKKALFLMTLAAFLLLTSCTTQIGWVGIRYDNTVDLSYRSFNGRQIERFRLDGGQKYTLDYDVICTDGMLTLQVTRPDGSLAWEATFNQDTQGSFEYLSSSGGLYTLRILGDDTRGGVQFHWQLEN